MAVVLTSIMGVIGVPVIGMPPPWLMTTSQFPTGPAYVMTPGVQIHIQWSVIHDVRPG